MAVSPTFSVACSSASRHIDAPAWNDAGKRVPQTKMGILRFSSEQDRDVAFAILAGRIALWWWGATGDDFDVTAQLLKAFPVSPASISQEVRDTLAALAAELRLAQIEVPVVTRYAGNEMGNYDMSRLRHITDKSDRLILEALELAEFWPAIMLADARLGKVTGERPGTEREWRYEWTPVPAGEFQP